MIVKKFDIKTAVGNTVCGIKESYSTLRRGDSVRVQGILGISPSLEPTVPVYCKEDKFIRIDTDFDSISDFINTRNPFYTLLDNTMFICVIDARFENGTCTEGGCSFYVPQKVAGSELFTVKASGRQTVGCLYVPLLHDMERVVLDYVAKTPFKLDILSRRCVND